ncbi:hypothetical protein ACP4OV_010175 [Aristida adscensionis]
MELHCLHLMEAASKKDTTASWPPREMGAIEKLLGNWANWKTEHIF